MKPSHNRHVKIRVYGNVQGVFYRIYVKDRADELGINGSVKNRTDGTVEIVAEGEEEAIDEFVRQCRRGNEQSIIKRLRIVDGDVEGYEGFTVRG
ncbi:acylphosphatase [Candidatus Uhrbacteria bacterium CG_4_10_14_0_2_um_filter_41_7]|uniref:acylphosphatase n=1 Tax=Candidatus Uhrbacteria bacterium CG_4_9_14_3_um_filter_41_35 TaxID=1975034 RepID=A0A2M7XF70_9BACT|nr:MAG: acylphosphatase [Candidatus Uhrbacteria bacterium CG11_big_fil_rev_8_21_14_0_20_41_9]PIZ54447.1 MAG: acylphosphatase [Candidatus Uhrbacteria bacterium CG_4_10_14_0_2_um_filter_41_7]PJA46524.1 MAG: acylphosphatase [Candidatus Uhrbacteria bacterium CG_4_9_14_3_um_filter_41_35]